MTLYGILLNRLTRISWISVVCFHWDYRGTKCYIHFHYLYNIINIIHLNRYRLIWQLRSEIKKLNTSFDSSHLYRYQIYNRWDNKFNNLYCNLDSIVGIYRKHLYYRWYLSVCLTIGFKSISVGMRFLIKKTSGWENLSRKKEMVFFILIMVF